MKTFALTVVLLEGLVGVLIIFAVGLSGCSATDANGITSGGPDSGKVTSAITVENVAGQTAVTIPYDSLKMWLEQNRKVRIVSITSIGRGSSGGTTAFLIVYDKHCSNKCPDCGQPLPAEKAN